MKAIIGTAVGVLGLGALVIASTGRTSVAQPQPQPQLVGGGYATQFAPTTTSFAPPAPMAPVAPVVQERIVYRDRPAVVRHTASATPVTSSQPAPVYREPQPRTRSWKKSALIIGGSTAGGAGVGAVLGGKSGAKKGAVAGLIGGTVYDIATRNK